MVSGIQKCHGCVGDPQLSPKMRGSTHVPRADGDPQLSIGDPGTTFHLSAGPTSSTACERLLASRRAAIAVVSACSCACKCCCTTALDGERGKKEDMC